MLLLKKEEHTNITSGPKQYPPDICDAELSHENDSFLSQDQITKNKKDTKQEISDNLQDLTMILRFYQDKCHKENKKLVDWITSVKENCFEGDSISFFIDLIRKIIARFKEDVKPNQEILDLPNDLVDDFVQSFCSEQKINIYFINWLVQKPIFDSSCHNFKEAFLNRKDIINLFSEKSYIVDFSEKVIQEQIDIFENKKHLLSDTSRVDKLNDIHELTKASIYIFAAQNKVENIQDYVTYISDIFGEDEYIEQYSDESCQDYIELDYSNDEYNE